MIDGKIIMLCSRAGREFLTNKDQRKINPALHLASIRLIFNTRIYNISSVPQIIRFILEDAAILSKTNPFCKKQTRSKDKVKSKTMSAIFPSVWIFYLNHHGAEITVIWLVEQSSIKLLILIRY